MEDGIFGAMKGFDGSFDKVFAAGGENLEMDVIWDNARRFDETAGKVKVGLGGGGEGDFDFFVTEGDEEVEEAKFLVAVLYIAYPYI